MKKQTEQRPVKNPDCLLGYWPDKCDKCVPGECHACGWNPKIEKQRKAELREVYG